ncbi:MAG TPA: ABC transporter substrate-binding protein [Chloroflexota bacterium]|nr:ABC transporter substrate-binding protein [Chloroflexota bacterium]
MGHDSIQRRAFLKMSLSAGAGLLLVACGSAAALPSSGAPSSGGAANSATAGESAQPSSSGVAKPAAAAGSASSAPQSSTGATGKPAASSAGASSSSATTQAATVSLGFLSVAGDAPSIISTQRGYFKDVGITVENVPFDGGSKAIPALAAGQLDLTTGTADVNFFNAVARNIPLRLAGDDGLIAPGHDFYGIAVRNELVSNGKYKTIKDLKNLKVGVSSLTGALYYFLVVIAQKNGWDPKDYNVTTITFADSIVALKQGSIDAAVLVEPFASRAETDGNSKVVVRTLDVSPDVPGAHLMVSPQFLQKGGGDVAVRFFTGWLRGVRDYLTDFVGGKNPDDVVKMLQANKINIVPTAQNPTYDPDGKLPVKPVQDLFTYFNGLGKIEGKVDFASTIDTSAMAKAAAQLGPYKS